ncbi:MAG TPA: pitrilysin family protein, partial [Blastocatellia bacterium]|nr:pitrilysin family protein [Blastocatellia bacterium]
MVFLLVRKSASVANILLFLICPLLSALARTPFAQSPPPKQASPFVLPITKRDSLLNGLQLIVMERPGTGTVTMRLRINSGAMFDLAGKGGLAVMTADMALRGGSGLSAKNIADTVEQLGMTVAHSVGWDTTDFVISGPTDSTDSMFDLLNRAILNPTFDQKEFDSLKAQRVQAAKNQQADDADLVKGKAIETTFGAHPFGRLAGGTADSIGQITRADLSYFHKRFYIANNAELIVTGDTSIEQITRLGRARLGSWKKGDVVPASFRGPDPPTTARLLILDRPEAATARAAILQVGPSRRSDDYFAAMIMLDTLGQVNSRLASAMSGATIETELEPRMIPGPLTIKITAQASDIAVLIQSCLEAM